MDAGRTNRSETECGASCELERQRRMSRMALRAAAPGAGRTSLLLCLLAADGLHRAQAVQACRQGGQASRTSSGAPADSSKALGPSSNQHPRCYARTCQPPTSSAAAMLYYCLSIHPMTQQGIVSTVQRPAILRDC